MWKLAPAGTGKELRAVFVETLQEIMKDNKKVVALEADLGGASGFTKIQKTNPDQFVQVGIAEANMVGIAAGMSMRGYIPYIHTFAPFATRRVLDQVFLEGAYAKNTINIYGSDPGVCVAANGGTHNSFEDIALMRSIPETLVVAPCSWPGRFGSAQSLRACTISAPTEKAILRCMRKAPPLNSARAM